MKQDQRKAKKQSKAQLALLHPVEMMSETVNRDLLGVTNPSKSDLAQHKHLNRKYQVSTTFYSPMNSTQLTGVPSWRS